MTLSNLADEVVEIDLTGMSAPEIYDLAVLVAIRAAFDGRAIPAGSKVNSIPLVMTLIQDRKAEP